MGTFVPLHRFLWEEATNPFANGRGVGEPGNKASPLASSQAIDHGVRIVRRHEDRIAILRWNTHHFLRVGDGGNHVQLILESNGIRYARAAVTENRSKPDFLFPSLADYHNASFEAGKLTMLGVKSTCKDRWRQVLAEADRIQQKHLLTLETAISTQQTDEMTAKRLQLVVPSRLHETYTASQRSTLWNVAAFTDLVRQRQASAGAVSMSHGAQQDPIRF